MVKHVRAYRLYERSKYRTHGLKNLVKGNISLNANAVAKRGKAAV